jgi:hypothetical protein
VWVSLVVVDVLFSGELKCVAVGWLVWVSVGGRRAVQVGVHRGCRGVTYVGCSVGEWRAVLGGANCGCRGVAGVGVIGGGVRVRDCVGCGV